MRELRGKMDREQFISVTMRRAHNALKTPHGRRLAGNRVEPMASYGLRRCMWFGSRINETIHG